MASMLDRFRALLGLPVVKEQKTFAPYAVRIGRRSLTVDTTQRGPSRVSLLRGFADRCEPVRAAINRRTQQVAESGWQIVRVDDPKRPPDPRVVESLTTLFRYVNPTNLSLSEVFRQVIEDVLVLDAGCIEKELTVGGGASKRTKSTIEALWPVDGSLIAIDPAWAAPTSRGGAGCSPDAIRYRQRNLQTRQVEAELRNDQLVYIMQNPRTYRILGFSQVEMCLDAIDRALYGEAYAYDLIKNPVPPGLLGVTGLTGEKLTAFRTYYNEELAPGEVPIVGTEEGQPGGITYARTAWSPHDLMFDEYRKWLVNIIAYMFQIDKTVLGQIDDVNRSTSETMSARTDEGYVALALRVASYITREIVAHVDPNHGFEFTDLRTLDPVTQGKLDVAYVSARIWTVNEVRARMGFDPVPWGDEPAPTPVPGGMGLGLTDDPAKPDAGSAKSIVPFVREHSGPNATRESALEANLHALTDRERRRLSDAWDRRATAVRREARQKLSERKAWSADDFADPLAGLADELVKPATYRQAVNYGRAAFGQHRDDSDPVAASWIDHTTTYATDVPDRLAAELADAANAADTPDASVQDVLDAIDGQLEALRSSVTRYADPPWGAGWNGYGEQLRSSNILMAWELDSGNPCVDCLGLEAGSPYETLPTWPGMGDTQCRDNCKCRVTADQASWDEALGGT
jgi:hypothetical protein